MNCFGLYNRIIKKCDREAGVSPKTHKNLGNLFP